MSDKQVTKKTIGQIISAAAEKYAPGDDEFKRVLHAIALAESRGNPRAVGDNGNSIGLFQNNRAAGRGIGYTIEQLMDPEFNADLSAKDLVRYYQQGVAKGLKGADLVAYVSRTGQRPAAGLEWNAAREYGKTVDNVPTTSNKDELAKLGYQHVGEDVYYKRTDKQPEGYELYQTGKDRPLAQPTFPPEQAAAEAKKPWYEKLFNIPGVQAGYEPSASLQTAPSQVYSKALTQPGVNNQYTVKAGDTLWQISQDFLGAGNRWKELGYQGNPNTMPIGTKVNIPGKTQTTTSKLPIPTYPSATQTRVPTKTSSTIGVQSGVSSGYAGGGSAGGGGGSWTAYNPTPLPNVMTDSSGKKKVKQFNPSTGTYYYTYI